MRPNLPKLISLTQRAWHFSYFHLCECVALESHSFSNILSLFVLNYSFLHYLGKAMLCGCGLSRVILRSDLFYFLPCVILFLCFCSPLSIVITSLGKKRANLSAFRTFVRFVFLWICRFPLPLSVWEGLRFVSVALPGLFSYLCFFIYIKI